jgi:hypothetical protein
MLLHLAQITDFCHNIMNFTLLYASSDISLLTVKASGFKFSSKRSKMLWYTCTKLCWQLFGKIFLFQFFFSVNKKFASSSDYISLLVLYNKKQDTFFMTSFTFFSRTAVCIISTFQNIKNLNNLWNGILLLAMK